MSINSDNLNNLLTKAQENFGSTSSTSTTSSTSSTDATNSAQTNHPETKINLEALQKAYKADDFNPPKELFESIEWAKSWDDLFTRKSKQNPKHFVCIYAIIHGNYRNKNFPERDNLLGTRLCFVHEERLQGWMHTFMQEFPMGMDIDDKNVNTDRFRYFLPPLWIENLIKDTHPEAGTDNYNRGNFDSYIYHRYPYYFEDFYKFRTNVCKAMAKSISQSFLEIDEEARMEQATNKDFRFPRLKGEFSTTPSISGFGADPINGGAKYSFNFYFPESTETYKGLSRIFELNVNKARQTALLETHSELVQARTKNVTVSSSSSSLNSGNKADNKELTVNKESTGNKAENKESTVNNPITANNSSNAQTLNAPTANAETSEEMQIKWHDADSECESERSKSNINTKGAKF